jgi:hypothetical protein
MPTLAFQLALFLTVIGAAMLSAVYSRKIYPIIPNIEHRTSNIEDIEVSMEYAGT